MENLINFTASVGNGFDVHVGAAVYLRGKNGNFYPVKIVEITSSTLLGEYECYVLGSNALVKKPFHEVTGVCRNANLSDISDAISWIDEV